jgi:GDPmannose 4,6-dehydratase
LKKALIFGSSGQDGYYLDLLLKSKKISTINISRSRGEFIGSVGDFKFVSDLVKKHLPDYIFHFAADSTTRHGATLDNNCSISTGAINILESVTLHSPFTKIFISGSALQFKNIKLPIDENTSFDFSSSYAISRNYSVQMARYYRQKFNINVYIGYFFNHDSPLRSENHINQKIVAHVVKVLNGSKEKLLIGNLEVQKEFNFAGDIVEAVWILLNQDEIFEVVLGNGKPYMIKDWVNYCFSKYSLKWENYIIKDESYKSEYEVLVSNPITIKKLGWTPKINFIELADLMLEAELKKH